MYNFSHQRSLATELTMFHLENKTQAVLVINGLNNLLCDCSDGFGCWRTFSVGSLACCNWCDTEISCTFETFRISWRFSSSGTTC